jgi:hypothetical protein
MKATKLLVAGVAIMSAGFGLSGNANAAESRSTAEVEIEAGELILDSVPDFKFADVTVEDIFETGVTDVPLVGGNLDFAPSTTDGDNTLTAGVIDYRGADVGWDLRVSLAEFTRVSPAEPTATLDGVTMNLTTESTTIGGNSIILESTGSEMVLANPDEEEGQGPHALTFAPGDTNTISIEQQIVRAGAYHAELTWTLADVPGPSTPN